MKKNVLIFPFLGNEFNFETFNDLITLINATSSIQGMVENFDCQH